MLIIACLCVGVIIVVIDVCNSLHMLQFNSLWVFRICWLLRLLRLLLWLPLFFLSFRVRFFPCNRADATETIYGINSACAATRTCSHNCLLVAVKTRAQSIFKFFKLKRRNRCSYALTHIGCAYIRILNRSLRIKTSFDFKVEMVQTQNKRKENLSMFIWILSLFVGVKKHVLWRNSADQNKIILSIVARCRTKFDYTSGKRLNWRLCRHNFEFIQVF